MSQNDQHLPQESQEPIDGKSRRSPTLIFGGWLTISVGVISLSNGLMGILGESSDSFDLDVGFSRTNICGTLLILIGIVSIAGGVCAFKGRFMSLSIAGAMLGMIGGGYLGFFMGLAALVLFAMSSGDL